jgi:hypothetical protein
MSDERRERYAAALATSEELDWDLIRRQYPLDVSLCLRNADAAMAVADAERFAVVYELAAELATAKAENGTLRDQLNAANEKAAWAEVQADGVRDTLRIYGDQTRQLQSDNARLRAELNRFEMERDSLLMKLHKATDGRDGWDQS